MTYEELTTLFDAAKGVETYLAANLRRCSINFEMAVMLMSVNATGGESVGILGVHYYGSNRTYGISKLEDLGYLVRVNDGTDGRRKHVRLTKAGKELVENLLDLLARIHPFDSEATHAAHREGREDPCRDEGAIRRGGGDARLLRQQERGDD